LALSAVSIAAAKRGEPLDRAADRRPPYEASIHRIGPELRERMTSWRRGCPVHIRDLRLVRVTVWGFDQRATADR